MPETINSPPAYLDGDTLDALRRKQRSEKILVNEGIPVNPDLPPVTVGKDFIPRGIDEVAMRTLCVLLTAIKADQMEQPMVLRVVRKYGLAGHFSSAEKEFIREIEPAMEDRIRFLQRYESAWVLLWSLGYVDQLKFPSHACDAAYAVACMRDRNTQNFISAATLRPLDQILDQADLIFRYRWPLRDRALIKRIKAAGLSPGVVDERYRALNWLIRASDQQWDHIAKDA